MGSKLHPFLSGIGFANGYEQINDSGPSVFFLVGLSNGLTVHGITAVIQHGPHTLNIGLHHEKNTANIRVLDDRNLLGWVKIYNALSLLSFSRIL